MLVLRKSDFQISGGDKYNVEHGTHLEVSPQQAAFVNKNPKENGPKLALFLVNIAGFNKETADAAFLDMLRKESDAQKNGAPAYDPPMGKTVKTVEPPANPEVKTDETAKAEAIAGVRKVLEAIEDKDAIVAYAVKTLGMKADTFDKRWGRDRVIEAVMANLSDK